jgi:hypothetical protein
VSRYARKTDTNQAPIVEALEKIGCRVQSLAALGRGAPDLLVCLGFRLKLMEIKNPEARGKLNKNQKAWHELWRQHVCVVESPEDAISVMTK